MSLSSFGIQLLTQIFDRLSLKRKKRKPFKRAYLHLWEPEKYHPKHLASFIWQAFEKIFTRGMSESNLKIFLQKDIVDEYLEYAELVFKILKGLAFPSSIYNMPSELRKFLATKLTLFEYSIEKYQLQHLIDEFFGKDKSIIVKESAIPNKMFYLKEITLKAFRGKLDLLETYNFLNALDISYLHVFTYSERPNTEAVLMDGVVPLKVRHKRSKMLRGLSVKKRRAFYETQIGNTLTVLFEQENKDGFIHGFTENYVKVKTKWKPELKNTLHKVKLLNIDDDGLVLIEFVDK